jgi:hypothetical protein
MELRASTRCQVLVHDPQRTWFAWPSVSFIDSALAAFFAALAFDFTLSLAMVEKKWLFLLLN